MTNEYDAYNEITFEVYVLRGIDRAILKEKQRKAKTQEHELSLHNLSKDQLLQLSTGLPLEEIEQVTFSFQVGDMQIAVHNRRLGQALSYLNRTRRETLLLSFFLEMSDSQVAKRMNVSKSTVQRRRKAAIQELHDLMEREP